MHLYLIYRIKQKITLNLWYLTQRPKFDLKEIVLETPGPGEGVGELLCRCLTHFPSWARTFLSHSVLELRVIAGIP